MRATSEKYPLNLNVNAITYQNSLNRVSETRPLLGRYPFQAKIDLNKMINVHLIGLHPADYEDKSDYVKTPPFTSVAVVSEDLSKILCVNTTLPKNFNNDLFNPCEINKKPFQPFQQFFLHSDTPNNFIFKTASEFYEVMQINKKN